MKVAPASPETVLLRKFYVPIDLAVKSGPLDQLQQISDARISALRRFAGLDYARWITEVGCGFGMGAISLSDTFAIDARYLGVDTDKDAIDWAHANITAQHPSFWFYHTPDEDSEAGTSKTVSIPADDNSQDIVFIFDAFTHVYPEGLNALFREFGRVLRPGGVVFASMYVIRPGLIQHLTSKGGASTANLTFVNMIERGFYLNDPADPDGPTGYSVRKIGTMARRARLFPSKFVKGGWANDGRSEIDGPDAVVLTKPAF